jgi:hypothetical protein
VVANYDRIVIRHRGRDLPGIGARYNYDESELPLIRGAHGAMYQRLSVELLELLARAKPRRSPSRQYDARYITTQATPALASTGKPDSSHAAQPPTSARALRHPAFLSLSAARALVASSIQAQ